MTDLDRDTTATRAAGAAAALLGTTAPVMSACAGAMFCRKGGLNAGATLDPVPPSQRAEVEIPAALDRVILAGLAKPPGERPQSMREFAQLLSQVEILPAWTSCHHPQ